MFFIIVLLECDCDFVLFHVDFCFANLSACFMSNLLLSSIVNLYYHAQYLKWNSMRTHH